MPIKFLVLGGLVLFLEGGGQRIFWFYQSSMDKKIGGCVRSARDRNLKYRPAVSTGLFRWSSGALSCLFSPGFFAVQQGHGRKIRRKWAKTLGLSGLVASDSAICAALILRLQLAGLRIVEFRPPQIMWGWLGLAICSNRSGLRPTAIWICGHKPKTTFPLGNRLRFRCGLKLRATLRPKALAICGCGWNTKLWAETFFGSDCWGSMKIN